MRGSGAARRAVCIVAVFCIAVVCSGAGMRERQPDSQNGGQEEDVSQAEAAAEGSAWIAASLPEYAAQGDPVFIRVEVRDGDIPFRALLLKDGKTVSKAPFYTLTENKQQEGTGDTTVTTGIVNAAFAAIPLSTWTESGEYTVRIVFSEEGYEPAENAGYRDYPLTVITRDFIRETIPLNESNTTIRTDTSEEKLRQIQKLNNILLFSDPEGVWDMGPFVSPVSVARRTSCFGDRRIFTYSNGKKDTTLHYGIDYGVPRGTPVLACGRGRVMLAEFRVSTGWSVVIEHLPGLYSLYYHMDSLNVAENDILERGQQIGFSGSTGLSTGPHLHWEMRLNGEAVHPDYFTERFSLGG